MIRRNIFILTVFFLIASSLAVNADVIPMTPGNMFYFQHEKECVSVSRNFYANGESGSVSIKEVPGSDKEIDVIKNNNYFYVRYAYDHNGESWGFVEYPLERRWISGWVLMSQLLLEYDQKSFVEEHGNEFYPYPGSLEALRPAGKIFLWSWPGSGNLFWSKRAVEAENIVNNNISHAYKDKQGQEWVFIKLFQYGNNALDYHFNVWICISDPSNDAIPAFNPPRPMPWPPAAKNIQSAETNTPNEETPEPILITIILVAVLVSGTAILIRIFWKPNKDNKED